LAEEIIDLSSHKVINLDNFMINSTKEQRHLFFKRVDIAPLNYSHGASVSDAAKTAHSQKKINEYSVSYKFNLHWVSARIYCMMLQ